MSDNNVRTDSNLIENIILLTIPIITIFILAYLAGLMIVATEGFVPTKKEEIKETDDYYQRLPIKSDDIPGQNFTSLEFAKQYTS
jgi:hypothetical protein